MGGECGGGDGGKRRGFVLVLQQLVFVPRERERLVGRRAYV